MIKVEWIILARQFRSQRDVAVVCLGANSICVIVALCFDIQLRGLPFWLLPATLVAVCIGRILHTHMWIKFCEGMAEVSK